MKNNKISKKIDETINGKPKRIYFMFPVYLVGGGETFCCRMIEYLLTHTDIKIGIIDYKDGMLARTCKKFFSKVDIDYIDYERSSWELEDNSVIFAGADHVGAIKPIEGKNIRILVILLEGITGWNILFEKKTINKLGKLLKTTNGLCFIDKGCYVAGCKQLKQSFHETYIPLFFYTEKYPFYKKETSNKEINLIWLGRFAGSKEFSIYNIIDNFAKYKTTKKKVFHLIGNGPLEERIKEYADKYSNEIKFIFPGVMTGEELSSYVQKKADIGIAMGTSVLNIASLGIPVILAHQSSKKFFYNKFLWLKDMYGYCAGTPMENDNVLPSDYSKLTTFDKMLDDVCQKGKREDIGHQCQSFYEQTFGSLENIGLKFMQAINQTILTYDLLKKTLKFLPYNDINGLAVQTYRFLHIPFLKVKHWGGKRRYFLFGLPICKIHYYGIKKKIYLFGIPFIKFVKDSHKSSISILGIKIFDTYWWGKYAYYEATNLRVKEECKNKYAITKRIIK